MQMLSNLFIISIQFAFRKNHLFPHNIPDTIKYKGVIISTNRFLNPTDIIYSSN